MQRFYCTAAELIKDIDQVGDMEALLMEKIEAASRAIEQDLGQFIPSVETRKFDGNGRIEMQISPLISLTAISLDGTSLTSADYVLLPKERAWPDGPYLSILAEEDSTLISTWSKEREVVEISGSWGLYSEVKSCGTTTAAQTDAETSLVVADGAKVSPGMVLLIGTEQELVTANGALSDSTANLSADINDSEDEITVSDGTKVNAGEVIKVNFEKMLINDISGNVLQVARGWGGTRRNLHLTGADINVLRTFTVERGVNGTTAASHTNAALSRYVAPPDVNWLCRQIAGLMIKKAQTGYTGRSGNDDLGTGFWVNEYPRDPIEKTRARYYVPKVR